MGNFYGIPGIKYISHGEWNDPEVEYKGYTFNYWDVEDALYNIFKQEFKSMNSLIDDEQMYVSKETGEILSFEDWLNQNKDLVYSELDDFIAFSKYDYDDIVDDDYFDDDGYYNESNKISEAYWENERNPQIKYRADVKYKLFNDDDFDTFSDTYYIDSDYSLDEVESYITRDVLLVCGGGYNTKNIEKATVKINGKVVYELDNTKTESKNRGKKKVSENQDYNCYTGIYHIRNITEYAQDELVSIGKRFGCDLEKDYDEFGRPVVVINTCNEKLLSWLLDNLYISLDDYRELNGSENTVRESTDDTYKSIEELIDGGYEYALDMLRNDYEYEVNGMTTASATREYVTDDDLIDFYGGTYFVPGDFYSDSWEDLR